MNKNSLKKCFPGRYGIWDEHLSLETGFFVASFCYPSAVAFENMVRMDENVINQFNLERTANTSTWFSNLVLAYYVPPPLFECTVKFTLKC